MTGIASHRPTVTVALITKNEAFNIKDCLRSVDWADEIVVVDSGSTDGTQEIARKAGAKVIETGDWPGFGQQKNRALQAATGDWIVSIDADERVTAELASALQECIAVNENVVYETPRLTHFMGQPVHHCGWYPDYGIRLFKRGAARFSNDLVHEHLMVDHPRKRLKPHLLHYSYRDQGDVVKKIQLYGRAGALQVHARGRQVGPVMRWVKTIWAWIRTYVFRLGILDGSAGWQIARMNALTTYLKYQPVSKHQ